MRCFSRRTGLAVASAALALLAAVPVTLVTVPGCAGGHGFEPQDRADVPESFVGIFDGSWSLPLAGRSGQFVQVVVSGKGVMNGFYTDATRQLVGELTGYADPLGKFFADVNFPSESGGADVAPRLRLDGTLLPVAVRTTEPDANNQPQEVDKQGLQGTLRQRVDGTERQGEFLLISRAPGVPTGSGNGGSGGAVPTDAGAVTAICRDGTVSYSTTCEGTCSSHGGIARSFIGCGTGDQ